MAQRDPIERRADADLATLFWWRRETAIAGSKEPALLNERLASLAERASPRPRVIDLPGNRLRDNAALRRAHEAPASHGDTALAADVLAAIRAERRSARIALAIGLMVTAAPVAVAIHAAIMQQPVALGLAIAGGVAASFALYHAARWFLLTRADAPPNFLA